MASINRHRFFSLRFSHWTGFHTEVIPVLLQNIASIVFYWGRNKNIKTREDRHKNLELIRLLEHRCVSDWRLICVYQVKVMGVRWQLETIYVQREKKKTISCKSRNILYVKKEGGVVVTKHEDSCLLRKGKKKIIFMYWWSSNLVNLSLGKIRSISVSIYM